MPPELPEPAPDPDLAGELGAVLRDLAAAEPTVAATPPGIDSGGIDRGGAPGGASPWRVWEISTPPAGSP